MNKNRNVQWTEIDTGGDDTDTTAFELNLEGEEVNEIKAPKNVTEEEDLLNVRQESQDTRRPVLTVSKNQEDKNNKARAEDEEDQEERTVQNRQTRQQAVNNSEDDEDGETSKRNSRAHKRIQTLHRRATEAENQLYKERLEKQELRKQLALVQKKSAETSRDSFKNQLDAAESELEKAIQDNDAPRIAKLTKAIADTTMKYNAYQAVTEEIEEPVDEQPVQRVEPQGLEAAKSWLKRNPKFLNDRVFHVNARLISEEISSEGVLDPNDDEYWEELDKRLKKNLRLEDSEPVKEEKKQVRRSSPVGSRNDEDAEDFTQVNQQFKRQGNRVQVTPTAEDLDIAEKFNIPMKDLMKEKYKYAQQGYKGYVEIDIPGQSRNN